MRPGNKANTVSKDGWDDMQLPQNASPRAGLMPSVFLVCVLCGLALLLGAADAEPIVRCQIRFKRRNVAIKCDRSGEAHVWIHRSVAASLVNVTKSRVPCGNVEALVELCSRSASLFVHHSNLSTIAGNNSLFREAIAGTAGITEVFDVPVDSLKDAVKSLLGKALPTQAALAIVSRYSVTWHNGTSANVRNITALHITAGRSVTVDNSSFASSYEGSCLRVNGSHTQGLRVTIKDTVFDHCLAPMGSYPIIAASQGGGLHVDFQHTNFSALTLAGDVTFSNCRASEGGGLYVQGSNTTGAVVTLTGSSTFANNVATGTSRYANGGACVFKFGAEYTLGIGYLGGYMDQALNGYGGGNYTHVTISFEGRAAFVNNSALRDGGAVAIKMAMSMLVNVSVTGDVEFRNNSAVAGRGGAVYLDSIFGLVGNVITMRGARLAGNVAGRDGGAMQVSVLYSRTVVLISNCTFIDNVALTGSGGALNLDVSYASDYDIDNLPSVDVAGSLFERNSAANSVGGGVFIVGRSGTCNEITYLFNCATAVSGLSQSAKYLVTISDSVLVNNSATFGGGLFTFGALVSVSSTNFTNNSATLYGGAVYAKSMLRLTMVNINATGNRWAAAVHGSTPLLLRLVLVEAPAMTAVNTYPNTDRK
jgi:predicted outer membrane repeat protein